MNYDDDETNPFSNASSRRQPPQSPTRPSGPEYNPFTSPGIPAASPAAIQPTFAPYAPTPASSTYQAVPYSSSPMVNSPPPIDYRGFMPPPPVTTQPVDSNIKNKEFEEREARLAQREQALKSTEAERMRKNNFPPLPACCPIQPCFHQNIKLDIPVKFQLWVRISFILWTAFAIALVLNVIVAAAYLAVDSNGATTFGVSFVFLFILLPCSYLCWHRPVYRAFRTDSSLFFMTFFFMSILFIGTNILFATGYVAGLLKDDKAVGGMMVFMGIVWSVIAVVSLFLLIKTHRIYRSSGASMKRAQAELQSNFVNSPTVRGAATSGINNALGDSNA